MPAAGYLHIVIAVGLAIHAMKTGRPFWWLYILIFVPLLGSIAYVLVEIIPSMARTRSAQSVKSNIGTMLDPDKEWRERERQAELVDSADAKRALAEEYEKRGMWADAIRLYETAATGIFADDPVILLGLARAQLGNGNAAAALEILEKLREDGHHWQNQNAHLLYARALEANGQLDEALEEYKDVSGYYAGFEARSRYALLLLKEGHAAEAQTEFADVVRASTARPVVITPADKEWIRVARSHLR
jgi:hypothetical protein